MRLVLPSNSPHNTLRIYLPILYPLDDNSLSPNSLFLTISSSLYLLEVRSNALRVSIRTLREYSLVDEPSLYIL